MLVATVLGILLVAFTIVLMSCTPYMLFPALYTEEVAVEIGDGWVTAEPGSINRCTGINCQVTNAGSETHMFIVVETDFAPDELPVENSQVRSYTYIDEPQTMIWWIGRYGSEQRARELPPDVPPLPPEPAEGPLIAPGETRLVQLAWDMLLESGRVFVLFCNCPGHYQRGEYTTLTIK